MSVRHVVLIAACLVASAGVAPVAAQSSLSVMAGVGQPEWSGPYVTGGKIGVSFLGVAVDRPVGAGWTARAEFAGQQDVGDLGITGLFEQPTSVVFYRARLAAIGRRAVGGGRLFVEAGGSGWIKAGCDVDTSGGPGFFGGQTVGCHEWSGDDPSPGDSVFRPKSTGVNLVIGAGMAGRKFAALVRFEPVGTTWIDTHAGAIRGRSLTLVVEWSPSARR